MDNAKLVDAPDPRVKEYYEQRELLSIAGKLNVPVNDDEVRRKLRSLGASVELARETKEERRGRLISHLAQKAKEDNIEKETSTSKEEDETDHLTLSVTEGSSELFKAREEIAKLTTNLRSNSQTEISSSGFDERSSVLYLDILASQSGFKRPISSVKLFGSDLVAIGDWSGELSILKLDDMMSTVVKSQTNGQISDLSVLKNSIASAHMDGSISIHSFDEDKCSLERVALLTGNASRVTSLEFHPAGNLVVSGSVDKHWRLWDWQANRCLLEQDGHQQAINSLKITPDGSLLASAGSDKDVHVWDLRSGVQVATFQGHASDVVSTAWNTGVQESSMELATGGADNRCLVWDLRNAYEPKNVLYAHNSRISSMKFSESGKTLVTSSLDGTVKLWDGTDNYRRLKTFETGSRIMCMDASISKSNTKLVTGRWDRLVDLYVDGNDNS